MMVRIAGKGNPCLFAVLLFICCALAYDCPCADKKDCEHPTDDLGTVAEVLVFSNGSTNVKVWRWDTISTLVVPSYFDIANVDEANTMCVAHSHGRKFSITVDFTLSGHLDEDAPQSDKWIDAVKARLGQWHAEVLTIDLLHYFYHDARGSEADHTALAMILKKLKESMDEDFDITIKMACIVPWKPPCPKDNERCYFALLSKDICDYYVLNPDSFIDPDEVKCTARATIPFTKLLYGMSEYNVNHVPRGKMILGIPWHGYDYKCETLIDDVCTLKRNPLTNKCDFSQRQAKSTSYIVQHHGMDHDTHVQDDLYNAPQYTYTRDSQQHQVWFEDHYSLSSKYKLVKELGLKGIAVMYGDDLSTTLTTKILVSDALMWSWVSHEFLLAASTSHIKHHDLHMADSMAGVAVGCLLLGTALGTMLTCLALRSRIRRPSRSLLRPHDDPLAEDFHDEDDRHL